MEPGISTSTLFDVIQATPQLLKSFEAVLDPDGQYRSSLRSLRLVSRQAKSAGLQQAVTCFSLKLSTEPSSKKTLLQQGRFLSTSKLRKLRVNVVVSRAPIKPQSLSTHLPSWRRALQVFTRPMTAVAQQQHQQQHEDQQQTQTLPSPANVHELSSHTAQLHDFIAALGTCVASVTSLELRLTLVRPLSTFRSQHAPTYNPGTHRSSDEAGTELVSILINACPHLTHISVDGSLGEAALRVFWARCPLLNSLELLDNYTPSAVLLSLLQSEQLPHISHLAMESLEVSLKLDPCNWSSAGHREYGLKHAANSSTILTHLRMTHRNHRYISWKQLPKTLEVLQCSSHALASLRMSHGDITLLPSSLTRVEVMDHVYSINAAELMVLLSAAPGLASLTVVEKASLPIGDQLRKGTLILRPCTSDAILGLQLLHERVCDGSLRFSMDVETKAVFNQWNPPKALIPLQEMLGQLHPLPMFSNCIMYNDGTNPAPADGALAVDSWSSVGRLLPSLETLQLLGVWSKAEVLHFTSAVRPRCIVSSDMDETAGKYDEVSNTKKGWWW